jgi:Pvc16 N-terminal domain
MSSALAIAAVTAVLKNTLEHAMIDHAVGDSVAGDVAVTTLAPDRIETGEKEKAQLNVFLYHITPNSGWRNVGLPSHDDRGRRLSNAPLAVDLHYLLTAYGQDNLEAEIVLGHAVQALHEIPVLTREAIRKALAPPGPGSPVTTPTALAGSGLAEQVEQIKLTPMPMSTEEMYRVWSALQAHYRPTAAYQASVVLIEERRATRPALPVRERRVHVLPFRPPAIESVFPQSATPGARLAILGQNLKADRVRVRFGAASSDPETVSDRRIEVVLPVSLRAGINTVQVVHPLDLGTPVEPHEGFESNVAVFVLRPTIVASVSNVSVSTINGVTVASADVQVNVTPPVGKAQRVALLLNEFDPPADRAPRAYRFEAPPRDLPGAPETTAVFSFAVEGVAPATYLVRVRVDAAESALETDANRKVTIA